MTTLVALLITLCVVVIASLLALGGSPAIALVIAGLLLGLGAAGATFGYLLLPRPGAAVHLPPWRTS